MVQPSDASTVERITSIVSWLELCGSFRSFQQRLTENDLPSGTGWQAILQRLISGPTKHKLLDVLEPYLAEVAVFGSKTVFLVDVAPALRSELRGYAQRFPKGADGWELPEESDTEVVVRSPAAARAPAIYVVRSTRGLTRKVPIDRDWVDPERLDELGAGVELFAMSVRHVPVFDVLRVPASGPITLHITSTFNQYQTTMKPEYSAERLLRVVEADAETDIPVRYVDLFNLVEHIYDDPSEGRVAGLKFRCQTGARRTEDMTSKKDLRTEAYHLAGIKKTTIEAYALTVAWPYQGAGEELHLTLAGSMRNLDLASGVLRLPRADSTAFTEPEHDFVMKKLVGLARKHAPARPTADDE